MTAPSRNDHRTRPPDDRLSRILTNLVAVAAILGIPSGLYGYFASAHAQRVDKTFAFYQDFRSTDFQTKYLLLMGRWNAKADQAAQLTKAGDQDGLRKLESAVVADADGQAAFNQVMLLFDGLSACVDNGLCDNNAAASLLRQPAAEIASALGSHIAYVRKTHGNTTYGSGIFKTRALEKSWSVF